MTEFLNAIVLLANFVLVPALAYGSQLALGALGITLIYGILRFSHFAHGDVMAFGTASVILTTWWLQGAGITLGVLPTALLALPVGVAFTIGYLLLVDRVVYKFYRRVRAKPMIFVMASLGVMFITNGLTRLLIGPGEQRFADGERFVISVRDFREMTGLDEGLALRSTQALTVVVALIAMAVLFWFLNRTR
ncbi:MAG: branched-chain amino acid ABC transporter permease, partial [Rhodobacteraceae bacterium]|nr:branched-chain amino acid ABC transporter permease [Paracoccaceae bacterium]